MHSDARDEAVQFSPETHIVAACDHYLLEQALRLF